MKTIFCPVTPPAVSLARVWTFVALLPMLLALLALPAAAQSMPDALPAFDIFEYAIDGNSLLDDIAIERAVTPFLGEDKTLREVESARGALERAYHDAGYLTVVVSIPEQKVDAGVVALHVVEAEIGRLRVRGAEYHLPSGVRARVPELAEGRVPNFPQMQREMADLNRGADLKATPILRAGKAPGTVEVQLDVEDQLPLHGSVDYSNRQTPNTTAQRLSASLRYDNLWQLGHSVGLSVQGSPSASDEVRVASLTYTMPLDRRGTALSLYGVRSRSNLATLANAPGLGVLGNADILGVRYALPLGTQDDYTHYLSAGADYKDIKQSVVVNGAGDVTTPVSYVPLVASYTGNWLDADSPTALDITATLGLRGLLGNSDAEFAAKRAGASANFLAVRGGLQRIEKLGKWQLAGKAEFQLASGPLVSNEQFAAGGAESVRGYLEGELTGDHALRLSLELRTPPYAPAGITSSWRLTGLAFFDAVRLHTLQAVVPQPASQTMRGMGVGFRLTAPRGVSLEVDLAHALDDADTTAAGDNQVHARMLWEF